MDKRGYFSASRITELLAEGTGATRQTYLIDLALDAIGLKKEFDTPQMEHGRNTEHDAFEFCVKPLYPNAFIKSDEFELINDELGCSTDVEFTDSKDVLDIKCPQLKGFLESRKALNVSKQYYDQIQTQLLKTGGEIGYLLYYLQKPVTWGNADSWQDYDFENFDDNYFIKEIKKDEKRQEEILKAVEKYAPIKNEIIEMLLNAPELEFKEHFRLNDEKFRKPIKKSRDILKEKIYKYDNEFYIY